MNNNQITCKGFCPILILITKYSLVIQIPVQRNTIIHKVATIESWWNVAWHVTLSRGEDWLQVDHQQYDATGACKTALDAFFAFLVSAFSITITFKTVRLLLFQFTFWKSFDKNKKFHVITKEKMDSHAILDYYCVQLWVAESELTYKHLEMHGCIISTVATDDLVLSHLTITHYNRLVSYKKDDIYSKHHNQVI